MTQILVGYKARRSHLSQSLMKLLLILLVSTVACTDVVDYLKNKAADMTLYGFIRSFFKVSCPAILHDRCACRVTENELYFHCFPTSYEQIQAILKEIGSTSCRKIELECTNPLEKQVEQYATAAKELLLTNCTPCNHHAAFKTLTDLLHRQKASS